MIADRALTLAAMAILVALSTGCAGARTTVVADTAGYPISLSRAVRDANGDIVTHDRVVKVGTLHDDATVWGLLYSAIRFNPRTDISQATNEQVAAAGGDAVVNLRVEGRQCALDWIPLVSLLPIWPGCATIKVQGDIVKVLRTAPPAVVVGGALSGARVRSMEAAR